MSDKDIFDYSNPATVVKNAQALLGNDIEVFYSTRKNKKYMILNPENNKYIHFGEFGYEDYTKHKDKNRRLLFQKRNHKWKSAKKYSPAYLSYYLLW